MEHEYYIPNRSEAEDFVDIVELFLTSTSRYVKAFPMDVELQSYDDDLPSIRRVYASLELSPGSGVIKISTSEILEANAKLRRAVSREKATLKSEIQQKDAEGVNVIMSSSIDEEATRRATRDSYVNFEKSVSVTQGNEFFEWVSILVDKTG